MGSEMAPKIPDVIVVMESKTTRMVDIWSSVFAKRIAVPEIVAIASESRNHAHRNNTTCFNFNAILIVFQNELRENRR